MVVPSERTTADEVFTPLIIMEFFTAMLVMGVVPVEPIQTTSVELAEVLVMVRSLVVPPAEFDPSIKVLQFKILMSAPAMLPETEAVTPVFGLMVSVLVALDPGRTGITIGQVSDAEL